VLLNITCKSLEMSIKDRYLINLRYFWANRGFVNPSAGISAVVI
jgi:hypothetical protein